MSTIAGRYYELCKPRVVYLIVFTAVVGMFLAVPGWPPLNALIDALDSGKISFAGLDVFEDEPTPAIKVLMNGNVSLSPHIGAATKEAQDRIGIELAEQIITILK